MRLIRTAARLCRTPRPTVTVPPSGDCLSITQTPVTMTTVDAREYRRAVAMTTVLGTSVSTLTRGSATLPQGGSGSLRWSEMEEDPQEDPLAVHCFCVCSGSVLLGDLLGVSTKQIQGT